MIFNVWSDGRFELGGKTVFCVLGKGGVKTAVEKREGDGATPSGEWPLRYVLYRPDNAPPETALETRPISREDGWCDAPEDPLYNRPVALPYPASCERLWRDDDLYDYVVVLGHNDDPPVPGMGSAIFMHLQRKDRRPTEGCIALERADMLEFLRLAGPGDAIRVQQP